MIIVISVIITVQITNFINRYIFHSFEVGYQVFRIDYDQEI
jgi:hypothetical protein